LIGDIVTKDNTDVASCSFLLKPMDMTEGTLEREHFRILL